MSYVCVCGIGKRIIIVTGRRRRVSFSLTPMRELPVTRGTRERRTGRTIERKTCTRVHKLTRTSAQTLQYILCVLYG